MNDLQILSVYIEAAPPPGASARGHCQPDAHPPRMCREPGSHSRRMCEEAKQFSVKDCGGTGGFTSKLTFLLIFLLNAVRSLVINCYNK